MPENSNAAATAALDASCSYQRRMVWLLLASMTDLSIRISIFTMESSWLKGIPSEAGCSRRDPRLVCSSYVRLWPWVDLTMSLLRMLMMMLIPYLLCFVIKAGVLEGVNEDLRKVLMLQQVFSFLSVVLFVFCFGLVHDYMYENRSRRLLFALLANLLVFVFVELGRRRCDVLYSLNQRLIDQAKARARADLLPQATFGDIRHDTGARGESGCAICLADFEDSDVVSRLPCQHIFHTECIREWLAGGLHCGCPMRCDGAVGNTVVGAPTSVSI